MRDCEWILCRNLLSANNNNGDHFHIRRVELIRALQTHEYLPLLYSTYEPCP